MRIDNRTIGVAVLLVSVLMAYLIVSYVNTLVQLNQESCTCGDFCGMTEYETPIVIYAAIVGVSTIFFIGVTLILKGGSLGEQKDNRKSLWQNNLDKLEKDEKELYKLIMNEQGTVFQGDLVEKSGLSKVKVSRMLDKLEARRLLERKRRGLTNIVVLK